MKISDNTSISMPMRNLLSILAAVAIGVWAYFGVIERLNIIGLYSSEEFTSELEQQNSQAENIYAKIDITKIC